MSKKSELVWRIRGPNGDLVCYENVGKRDWWRFHIAISQEHAGRLAASGLGDTLEEAVDNLLSHKPPHILDFIEQVVSASEERA